MEAAPSPLANARPTKEKFCLQFLICARPFFLLKGKQNFSLVFCSERAGGGAGLYFCKSMAEFPPHPPSAMLLRGRTAPPAKQFLPPTPSTFCLLAKWLWIKKMLDCGILKL